MRLPLVLLLLTASPVLASSEKAWEEFRAAVETSCAALAPAEGETAIEVNPFGSESYGAALLITAQPDGFADRYICIYDKRTGKAELTAPFVPPEDMVEPMADQAGNVGVTETTHTKSHLVTP